MLKTNMRFIAVICAILFAISFNGCASDARPRGQNSSGEATERAEKNESGEKLEWLTDFSEARKQSAETGRPILADFTGSDWCIWCIRLKEEVFTQQSFQDYARKNLVLLEIDFPNRKPQSPEVQTQNRQLAERYEIRGYPTILLLDSEGEELARTGYRRGGAEQYVAHLRDLLSSAEK